MKTRARIRILPLLALVLAAGCSDLTDSGGNDVVGLTIEDQAGNTLVTVDANSSVLVTGSIVLPRNGSRVLNIRLHSSTGEVQPSITETVRVTITNSTLATWNGTNGAGTLTAGGIAGSTSMRIDLLSAGTVVFGSPAILVTVT